MEPSLAESLAQTMDPAMEHCWDRSLAASLVPQTASMMATATEPDLAQTRDQSWAATTAPSWEPNWAQMMAPPMEPCWESSLAPNLVHSKASTTVTMKEPETAQTMAES